MHKIALSAKLSKTNFINLQEMRFEAAFLNQLLGDKSSIVALTYYLKRLEQHLANAAFLFLQPYL